MALVYVTLFYLLLNQPILEEAVAEKSGPPSRGGY